MLSFSERMDNVEALMVDTYNKASDLADFDELDAVVTQIFDDGVEVLRSRIEAIKNNMDIVERIISTATGK